MLLGRKKEVKEENKLASGYTGRTQKLLREGKKKLAETEVKVALVLLDGEDRASCVINEATWVERAELDAPMVATALVSAASVNTNPLPDMSKFTASGVAPAPEMLIALITQHQEEQVRDMLAREAGAEALRRALLVAEKVEWRAAQMSAMFDAERTAAHERLKTVMAAFRKAKGVYTAKFAREAEAEKRLAEAAGRRAAYLEEEARMAAGSGAGGGS